VIVSVITCGTSWEALGAVITLLISLTAVLALDELGVDAIVSEE
jgi:hypothetical protein